MNIQLQNKCSQHARVCVSGGTAMQVPPWGSVSLELDMYPLQITIRNNCESFCKGSQYVFTIETTYHFVDVDSDACFVINREKVRVDGSAYFDRLLISTGNASCASIVYRIADESEIRKSYSRKRATRLLLTGPLENLTGLVFGYLLLGMIVAFALGWVAALVYFLCGYVLLILMNLCVDLVWKRILSNKHNQSGENIAFEDCFSEGFLSAYYSDLNRKPFMGEIETY